MLVWLPRPSSAVGTKFYLYTRFSRGDPTVIDDNDEEKLKSSNFVIARRTILIVHGYWGKKTEMFCIDETGQKFETKFVSRLTIHSRRETYFGICYSVRITLLEYTGLTRRGLLRLVSYTKILFYTHGPPAKVACYDIIKTVYTLHTCKSNCGTVRLPHQIIFKKHMVTEISKVFCTFKRAICGR